MKTGKAEAVDRGACSRPFRRTRNRRSRVTCNLTRARTNTADIKREREGEGSFTALMRDGSSVKMKARSLSHASVEIFTKGTPRERNALVSIVPTSARRLAVDNARLDLLDQCRDRDTHSLTRVHLEQRQPPLRTVN